MIPNLKPHHSANATVIRTTEDGWRLEIPEGERGKYRIAQLDDYTNLARREFPHRPFLRLGLRARASAAPLPGTWGFGLWNDPFGFSLGYGGNPLRIPALPNAVWFFHASEENYLSFSSPSTGSERTKPGNGFLAQVFRAPSFPFSGLAKVGLTLPFSRKKARSLMGQTVEEDGVRLGADVTEWHAYRLEWSTTRSAFWVDDVLALETSVSPRPPLGLVIWIDNQFAAWRLDGKIAAGTLANPAAWIEISDLELRN